MRVMIGTVIYRAEDGSCLPGGVPIYRDLPEKEGYTEPSDYYDFDDFASLMADKYQVYLQKKREAAQGKRSQTSKKSEGLPRRKEGTNEKGC